MNLYTSYKLVPPRSEDRRTPLTETSYTPSLEANLGILANQSTVTSPQSSFLYFDSGVQSYTPYSSKQSSLLHFYLGTVNPTLTTRLNVDAYLHATKLYSGGTEVSVSGHIHDDRYYTKTNLQTSGQAQVHWGNLTNIGIQSGTLYWDSSNFKYIPYSSKQSSLVHFYTGTTNPDNSTRLNLDASLYSTSLTSIGDITGDSFTSRTTTYSSGLTGSGYKLWKDVNSRYNLEIDNLNVRGSLYASELVMQKIKATNGTLLVSNSAKASSGLAQDAGGYYFTVASSSEVVFSANDLIRAKRYTGSAIYDYYYKVVTTSGTKIYVVNPDGSNPSVVDVTDAEFVLMGNTSESTRQSFILMSSIEGVSPRIDLFTGVNVAYPTTSYVSTRLGNLNGLTFNGTNISGMGLYAANAYLSGNIVANSGKLGGAWNIGSTNLYSTNNIINLSSNNITLNSGGVTKVRIRNDNISTLSSIIGGSNLSWTGMYAYSYTQNSHTLATYNNLSNRAFFVQSQSNANDTYLKTYDTDQDPSYYLDVASGKDYKVSYQMRVYVTYTLPADDTDKTDGYTYTNSIDGYYQITAKVEVYNSSDTKLAENTITTPTYAPVNGSSYPNYFDVAIDLPIGVVTTSQIYFKITYSITNSVSVRRVWTTWQYDENVGRWYQTGSFTTYPSIDTTFYVATYSVSVKGVGGIVEIGSNGFQNIYSATKYVKTNSSNTRVFEVYGQEGHGSDETGDVMYIARNNSDTGSPVITLVQAQPGTTGKVIQFVAGANNSGYIQYNSSTKTLSFVSDSDERLKEDITEATLDALSIIKAAPLKEFTFKDTKTRNLGWIAQDLLTIYPQAVANVEGYKEKGEYLGVAKDYLIEVLWRAVQQLTERLEKVESLK